MHMMKLQLHVAFHLYLYSFLMNEDSCRGSLKIDKYGNERRWEGCNGKFRRNITLPRLTRLVEKIEKSPIVMKREAKNTEDAGGSESS